MTSIGYTKGSTVIGALSYTYNSNGQRVEVSGSLAATLIPAGMSGATYDAANRLVNWAGSTKTYDTNGNLVSDGTSTYQWDSRERLISIGGNVNGSFSYDSSGRRVAKTINGSTVNFVYDGENFVQELVAGSSSATRLTGLLMDQFFSRTDSSGPRIAITDALGSTLALVDENGLTKTTYSYEPYGDASTGGESNANSTQYAGRENDGSGLYYYRNRYYSPQTSRFISEDSIGRANGLANAYAYVRGNPLSFIDPLGLYDTEPGLQPVCPECALIPIARAGRVIADLWPRQKEPQACPRRGQTVWEEIW
ncbi:RHS repeat-associated core domain-containing protein [Burkholderia ambifaria]|uniref:RHS repeat-associated core domain-containing protein n=1 Tax=Burkholderia ambifaria TaxID=152480 RepID=UPI00158F3804|nr:RHS repeat-associated core domain-containing protein [Burkholderia ambifaria]